MLSASFRLSAHLKLVTQLRFSYYIHLRDHDKRINPQQSRVPLSYMDPARLAPCAPVQKLLPYRLRNRDQRQYDKNLFTSYKRKVLEGIVDGEETKTVDELWGQGPVPVHYYTNLSKVQIMTVEDPHSKDTHHLLEALFAELAATRLKTDSEINPLQLSESELVEYGVKLRSQGVEDFAIWKVIEDRLQGKLYKLNTQQMIRLKYAISASRKRVTPTFTQVVDDLLRQDLPNMALQDLIELYYSLRYVNSTVDSLHVATLRLINSQVATMSLKQKIDWLLTYTFCRRAVDLKRTPFRMEGESKKAARSVLFSLQLDELTLDQDLAIKLLYSLAKLHLPQTRHLTTQLVDYIEENFDTFMSNPTNVYMAIFYIPQLESGQGAGSEQLFEKLRNLATTHWENFTSTQKIRILYTFWDLGMLDEARQQLYNSLQFEESSTFLYYACPIELAASTGREWQIATLLSRISYIPLPYFHIFKRFYNSLKAATTWNLTALQAKLANTEPFFDAQRQEAWISQLQHISSLEQWNSQTGLKLPITYRVPINNLQFVLAAQATSQLCLDIISDKQMVAWNKQLKQSYRSKVASLQAMGWKAVVYHQKQLDSLPNALSIISEVVNYAEGERESQTEVLKAQTERRAAQLKQMRDTLYWAKYTAEEMEGWINDPENYAEKLRREQQEDKNESDQIRRVQL